MANEIFRSELKKEIRSALQAYSDASQLDHSGLRGRVREILTEKLLRPILPPGVEIGTGKIVDHLGNLSSETDIVIYSRGVLPPLVYGHATGLFPIEACVYALEVKSVLTATELRSSIERVKRLKTLQYLRSFYPLNFPAPVGPAASQVIPALFAFSSDLNPEGKTEIERYRECDGSADHSPLIPVICIATHGYWWFKPDEPGRKWIKHLSTPEHDEIIDFIGGLANTIPIELIKKGQPYYGNYIIHARSFEKE